MALLRQCLLDLRTRQGDWGESERPLFEVAWTKPEHADSTYGPTAATRLEADDARSPLHE
jgi:hypothetical protein